MTKYDQFFDLLAGNWVGAVVLVIVAALAGLPSVRDGASITWSFIKKLYSRFRRITIKIGNEQAILTTMLREEDYDAVKIEADSHMIGVGAEYQWVNRKYSNCEINGQSLTTLDLLQGRDYGTGQIHFDVISIKLENGKTKDIYFDISSFFYEDSLSLLDPIDPKGKVGRKLARLYKYSKRAHEADARNPGA